MGSQNLLRRCVLAFTRMVVLHEAQHAVWKSAHTLCNACAGFHVMYIHKIGEEKKISTPSIISMWGGGGGEKGLVFVSKISVFTDDP